MAAQVNGVTHDPHPLSLAYLGDAVYELKVREAMLRLGGGKPEKLHRLTVERVCAPAQSRAFQAVAEALSDAEADVARRARNQRPAYRPRGVSPDEYARATALEAVFGYLYAGGHRERLDELFARIAATWEGAAQR